VEVLIDLSNVTSFMSDYRKIKEQLDIISTALSFISEDVEKSPNDKMLLIKKQNIEDAQWDCLIDATCVYQDLTMFFERFESDNWDIFLFRRLEKEFESLPYIDASFSFMVPKEYMEDNDGHSTDT